MCDLLANVLRLWNARENTQDSARKGNVCECRENDEIRNTYWVIKLSAKS